MINEDFYPTPPELIDRMVAPLVVEYETEDRWGKSTHRYIPGQRFLEPSAGKGDIIDHLKEHYNFDKRHIKCIELEPDLQATLAGKGYEVIDSDFLTFAEPYRFDLIVMNPPFSEGAKHLLKAWEVLADGHIVCLLNAETLNNPYTAERRQLYDLVQAHGRYETVGAAFAQAERRTEVEVAIVWLEKPQIKTVDFDDMKFEADAAPDDADYNPNPIANRNTIQALVDQYQAALMTLMQIHEQKKRLKFYTRDVRYSVSEGDGNDLESQVDKLKESFWMYAFERTKFGSLTTSGFQKDFERKRVQTERMAFSVGNIMNVLEELFLQRDQIIQRCIIEAFDKVTQYNALNIVERERWKTNKKYRVNKKVILPGGADNWGITYWYADTFNDIDKALCFLSGIEFESITPAVKAINAHADLIRAGQARHTDVIESTHFKMRRYLKGTVHCTFKDLNLLAAFNQAAAKGKGWELGGGY